jgi:hypothetical protein
VQRFVAGAGEQASLGQRRLAGKRERGGPGRGKEFAAMHGRFP